MRVLALLAIVLLIAPSAQAATTLQAVRALDDRVGQIQGAVEAANATYGDRDEFEAAEVELSRSGLALTKGATVVSEARLLKAYAALETGRTKAQAQGSQDPQQAVVDRAQELAQRADANVSRLRSDLAQAPEAGLEPVALDGLLAVAHGVIQTMDLLDQHRIHQRTWEQGHHNDKVARGLISTAASAALSADIASDLQARIAQARAETPVGQVITPETLADLSQARADWVQAQGTMPAREGQDRFLQLHQGGEHLLALAAFTLWYQDVAFNRLNTEAQRGADLDLHQIAEDRLAQAGDPVDAWHAELATASGVAQGALASAQLTLDLMGGDTSQTGNRSAAYAASLVDRAVEHTALVVQAFTGQEHVPGQPLAAPGTQANQEDRQAPLPVVLGLAAFLVAAAVRRRARRPRR